MATFVLNNPYPISSVTAISADLDDYVRNPMHEHGDMIYGGPAGIATRLTGNSTTDRLYLSQIGDNTSAGDPVWDIPNALEIAYTPAGTISSTDVQSAITELDATVSAIAVTIGTIDISALVPYTGAITEVDLGAEDLITTGDINGGIITATLFTGVVPYIGASTDVNLGSNDLTTTGRVYADMITLTGEVTNVHDAVTKEYADSLVGTGVPVGTYAEINGTPVDNRIAVWTDSHTIEGTSGLTYDGTTLGITGAVSSTTITAPVFTTSFGFAASKWRIVESGDHLSLQFNSTPKGVLQDNGTISFTGDVVAYSTL
jgi:hypothetical protein